MPVLAPPDFLQLAGHPLRWRLLQELATSDRTVQELTVLVDEAQNLVSYHLAKLRTAGLVSAHRSSADGRDTYYAADLGRIGALLTATAGALHPGLVPAPRKAPKKPAKVLFLCTGNSARSQMAEALCNARGEGHVRAVSAGSHPKPLHPLAVRVLASDHGLDLAGRTAKHLGVFARQRFDRVISLCDRVREVCPTFPGEPATAHWSIPDPSLDGTEAAFRRTAAELDTRIGFLLAALPT